MYTIEKQIDKKINYLEKFPGYVDNNFFFLFQNHSFLMTGKYFILRPDKCTLMDDQDLRNVKSVIDLKLVNSNPNFQYLMETLYSIMPVDSYYIGKYESIPQVKYRVRQGRSHMRYLIRWVLISTIGLLGRIPAIQKQNYIKGKFYCYGFFTYQFFNLVANTGLQLFDIMEIDHNTYFILHKL